MILLMLKPMLYRWLCILPLFIGNLFIPVNLDNSIIFQFTANVIDCFNWNPSQYESELCTRIYLNLFICGNISMLLRPVIYYFSEGFFSCQNHIGSQNYLTIKAFDIYCFQTVNLSYCHVSFFMIIYQGFCEVL